jgi:hypothetical protein
MYVEFEIQEICVEFWSGNHFWHTDTGKTGKLLNLHLQRNCCRGRRWQRIISDASVEPLVAGLFSAVGTGRWAQTVQGPPLKTLVRWREMLDLVTRGTNSCLSVSTFLSCMTPVHSSRAVRRNTWALSVSAWFLLWWGRVIRWLAHPGCFKNRRGTNVRFIANSDVLLSSHSWTCELNTSEFEFA